MNFGPYMKSGLLKKQQVNFKQISRQIVRAEKDLATVRLVLNSDPEWAATIAYQAMLRCGRALLFAHGYLPADGRQHKTVVELTGLILGEEYRAIIAHFERLRRKRNVFFYDSTDTSSMTEAKNAIDAAQRLVATIKQAIEKLNPQQRISIYR